MSTRLIFGVYAGIGCAAPSSWPVRPKAVGGMTPLATGWANHSMARALL